MSRRENFAARFRRNEPLTGVFQKFPHHQVTELLGTSKLDFAVLDSEHAPFDPSQLDSCLLAAAAWDLPLMVRIANATPDAILAALDLGASGIFVPHVDSAAKAAAIAKAAHYAGGGRGLSPSTRAGRYGLRDIETHMKQSDREILVVAQIEDAAALDDLPAIAETAGIDGLFVGRADLAASMGCGWTDPRLDEATARTADCARAAAKSCGAYAGDLAQARQLRAIGAAFIVAGSDQGMLRHEATRLASDLIETSG